MLRVACAQLILNLQLDDVKQSYACTCDGRGNLVSSDGVLDVQDIGMDPFKRFKGRGVVVPIGCAVVVDVIAKGSCKYAEVMYRGAH